jgi:hypothetical protein
MTTHNNNNALVLLLAACVCASLFCSISSYISSAFLTPGEKNDDTSSTPSPSDTPSPSSSPSVSQNIDSTPAAKAEGNTSSYFTEGVDYTIKGSRENPTRYCSNDSDNGMICDRTVLDDWEKFQFKHVGGNVYGIKSNRTGKYCKDNKTGTMTCDGDLNEHEELIIGKHGDKYSIKGPWGNKYCSDQPVGIICDTGPLDDWEKFTIKKVN